MIASLLRTVSANEKLNTHRMRNEDLLAFASFPRADGRLAW